jgi:hypothetical protein
MSTSQSMFCYLQDSLASPQSWLWLMSLLCNLDAASYNESITSCTSEFGIHSGVKSAPALLFLSSVSSDKQPNGPNACRSLSLRLLPQTCVPLVIRLLMVLLLSSTTAVPFSGLRHRQSCCHLSITQLYHLGAKHTSPESLVLTPALSPRRLSAASILERTFLKAIFKPLATPEVCVADKPPE